MATLSGLGPTSYPSVDRPQEPHLLHHQSYVESEAGSLVIFSRRLRLQNLVLARHSTWERICPLLATRFCTTLRWRRLFSAITLFVTARLNVRNLYVVWWSLTQLYLPENHVRPIHYRHHGEHQRPIPGNAKLGAHSLYNLRCATLS